MRHVAVSPWPCVSGIELTSGRRLPQDLVDSMFMLPVLRILTKECAAYVSEVLSKPASVREPDGSLVLLHWQAAQEGSWQKHQLLADWVLVSALALAPGRFSPTGPECYVARLSYAAMLAMCPTWSVFEELATELPTMMRLSASAAIARERSR